MNRTEALWQEAVTSLDPECKKNLDLTKTARLDVVGAALEVAEAKRLLSFKKRWKFKKPGGDEIIVRDLIEKIISWIRRFRDVGDVLVQYSPTYASLPWGAVRFLLQVAINETEIYGNIIDNLEMVTRLIARFRVFEDMFLADDPRLGTQARDALVRLYTKILEFLAKASSFFHNRTPVRALKSVFQSTDEHCRSEILQREAEVLKYADLADTERLISIETQIKRMSALQLDSKKAMDEIEYRKMLKWLSSVPFSSHQEAQRESRIVGTGEWILQHPQYRAWLVSSSCVSLLLHGIPGCGKTSLCSAVIDHYLQDRSAASDDVPLAYFYCSASISEPERRSASGVLRSLVRQLTVDVSTRHVHQSISMAYRQKTKFAEDEGFEVAKLRVSECVEVLLEVLDTNPATIVIDGLDELTQPEELLDALTEIQGRSNNIVKILLTSRDDARILALLSHGTTMRITDRDNTRDVKTFTRRTVDVAIKNRQLLRGMVKPDLREKIVSSLTSSAGEMFLWVKLQMDRLCDFKHEADLENVLASLSGLGVTDLYQNAYERITSAREAAREMAMRTFAWLLYAQDPLSPDVFIAAISRSTKWSEPQLDDIVDICQNLIYLDTQLHVIRFVHQSVQEFLRLQADLVPASAQQIIASGCLSICCDGPVEEITILEPDRRIYDYAAIYWGHHCSVIETVGRTHPLQTDMEEFLFEDDHPGPFASVWLDTIKLTKHTLPTDHAQKLSMECITSPSSSPFFPICVFGITSLLEQRQWPDNFDWNQRNDAGITALYIASSLGHEAIVDYLIQRGADVNLECGKHGSPLHCAAFRGHTQVSLQLLKNGADPKVGSHFGSVLRAACLGDHEDTVLSLLRTGVGISSEEDLDTVLQVAAEMGFALVIEYLQKHHLSRSNLADCKALAIMKAITSGKHMSLKLLLRDLKAGYLVPDHAVALSAQHGHVDMTAYLLDRGCDIEEPGDLGMPLRCASLMGHRAVCKLLIDRGADINSNPSLGTALHAAAMKGHTDTARLLLESGANVNVRGGPFGTCIQAAAYQGHEKVVELLVGSGANILLNGYCQDAIHAATQGGNYRVLRILLTSRRPEYWGCGTLTCSASAETIPRSLADASSTTSSYIISEHLTHKMPATCILRAPEWSSSSVSQAWTTAIHEVAQPINENYHLHPLQIAAAAGDVAMIDLLFQYEEHCEIDVETVNSAINMAAQNGQVQAVIILCAKMSTDLSSDRMEYLWSPLHEAASRAHFGVVFAVLERLLSVEPIEQICQPILMYCLETASIFREVYMELEARNTDDQVTRCLPICLLQSARDGHVDTIDAILDHLPQIDGKLLCRTFREAFDHGQTSVVARLLELRSSDSVILDLTPNLAREALFHCRSELFDCLFTSLSEQHYLGHLSNMIIWGAGNGLTSCLKLMLRRRNPTQSAFWTRALSIAAENGHIESCRLLFEACDQLKVDVDTVTDEDVLPDDFFEVAGYSAHDSREMWNLSTTALQSAEIPAKTAQDSEAFKDDSSHQSLSTNTVRSCLQGYKRFQSSGQPSGLDSALWKTSDVRRQTETLGLLLNKVKGNSSLNLELYLCFAVSHCPVEVVNLLLKSGADAKSKVAGKVALEYALEDENMQPETILALLRAGGAESDHAYYFAVLYETFIKTGLQSLGNTLDNSGKTRPTRDGEALQLHFDAGIGPCVLFLLEKLQLETIQNLDLAPLLPMLAALRFKKVISRLLGCTIDINAVQNGLGSALHAASFYGDYDIVAFLLEAGADPNTVGGWFHTPLRAAISAGHRDIVNLLLTHRADVSLTAPNPELPGAILQPEYDRGRLSSPMQLALDCGEYQVARSLCEAGADLSMDSTRYGRSSLLIQASERTTPDLPLVKSILDRLRAQTYRDRTQVSDVGAALTDAIIKQDLELVDLLLRYDYEISPQALTDAVSIQDTAILERILQYLTAGTLVTTSIRRAVRTAIERAAWHRNIDAMVVLFGSRRADELSLADFAQLLESTIRGTDTAALEAMLEHLSRRCSLEVIFEKISPVYMRTHSRTLFKYVKCPRSTFVRACVMGLDEVIYNALEQGMDPDAEDDLGRLMLHHAAAMGRRETVEKLITAGADVNRSHPQYGSPLRSALEGWAITAGLRDRAESLMDDVQKAEYTRGFVLPPPLESLVEMYRAIALLLLASGASAVDECGGYGSALHLAAHIGDETVFNQLVYCGADVHYRGGRFDTVLRAATEGHGRLLHDLILRSLEAK